MELPHKVCAIENETKPKKWHLFKIPIMLIKEHWTLEGKALRDFSKSETKRDRKKSYKHYLYIPKKYTSLPNEKGVAQYLGLPHPI